MEKIKRKSIVAVLAILLIVVLAIIAAVSQKDTTENGTGNASGKELTHVVLNEVAHSIFYAPMYVAIENDYFAEEGIDIELVTGYGADKTMTAVLTGEADVGFMGAEASLYTYVGDMEDYVVNFAQLTQRAGNFLVSREPIDNFTWDMLKGKEVLGGRAGGMPEMVFEYILSKNDIDKAELSIDQSIDFGSTAAAFSGGQGDFTLEFEPHATALEEKGDGYVVASLGEASGYVPYTSFSAKKSYIAENPEVIQSFTNALQKGMEYCNAHTSKEIAEIISPQFAETEMATLEKIVDRYKVQETWKTDLVFTEDAFVLLENILIDAGELQEMLPYEDLVTVEFAEKAVQ